MRDPHFSILAVHSDEAILRQELYYELHLEAWQANSLSYLTYFMPSLIPEQAENLLYASHRQFHSLFQPVPFRERVLKASELVFQKNLL